MRVINYGRASLETLSGKDSEPCGNCGDTHATMYKLSLAREFGGMPLKSLDFTLCVTCRSHIGGAFEKFSDLNSCDW